MRKSGAFFHLAKLLMFRYCSLRVKSGDDGLVVYKHSHRQRRPALGLDAR